MALQPTLQSLDEVDAAFRGHYVERIVETESGPTKLYALDIEGFDEHPEVAGLKNSYEKIQTETAKIETKLVDLHKEVYEKKIARMEKQLEEIVAQKDEAMKAREGKIERLAVRNRIAVELLKAGVKREAIPYIQAGMERSAKVVEIKDGEIVVAFPTAQGDKLATEYIREWAQGQDVKIFMH